MGFVISLATTPFAQGQGAAYAWGRNIDGELGNNSMANSAVPVRVVGLGGISAVAGGGLHSLSIQNGAAYAWGSDDAGQLGDNAPGTLSKVPVAVVGLTSGVTAIVGGGEHSLAIRNGAAYAWGENFFGQLGSNMQANSPVPVAVVGLSSGVTAIAAGDAQSLAIKNGAAYIWGYYKANHAPNATTDSPVPVLVAGLPDSVTAIAGGSGHSLAVRNGAAYAWGANFFGQLGNGSTYGSDTPVAVTGLFTGVTAIAAGQYFGLAVQSGHVFAWGHNNAGQLGNGGTKDSPKPVSVDPTNVKNIVAVAVGLDSSYALAADGSLWVWGNNTFGQLGLGNTLTPYLTPQHLLPPSGYRYSALSAEAGGTHVVTTLLAAPPSPFFAAEIYLGSGVSYLAFPGGAPFGYYAYLSDPHYIYHFDLGYEYIFDAVDGSSGVYLYDFKSGDFFYTSPSFPFPYLYDFSLNTVLYYYPDPNNAGHYNTGGVRYFYNFSSGQIISK